MPTVNEAMQADLSGYRPVPPVSPPAATPQIGGQQPTQNTMLRCPLPLYSAATPDSLRQFYSGGVVPQFRFLSPQISTAAGSSGTTVVNTTVIDNGGGGNTPTPPPTPPSAVQQAVTTTPISPGSTFIGVMKISSCFQLLNISSTVPSRVQLYGTLSAQLQDASRGIDVPSPAGTAQGIICDVVLDTSPYVWIFQNRTGANGDNPQQGLVYLTVTNLGQATNAIMVTVTYAVI